MMASATFSCIGTSILSGGAFPLAVVVKNPDLYIVLVLLACLCLMMLATASIHILRQQKRRAEHEFMRHCIRCGVNNHEKAFLLHLATIARLSDASTIFTNELDFRRGVVWYMQRLRDGGLTDKHQSEAIAKLDSLCRKIGHRRGDDCGDGGRLLLSTSQIVEGSEIAIMSRDGTGRPVSMTVVRNTADGVLLRTAESIPQLADGQIWRGSFYEGGTVWEFFSMIISDEPGLYLMGHSDNLRYINRRSFLRVSSQAPALVAPYKFTGCNAKPPLFSKAKLLEIAGPGLKLLVPLPCKVNQRLLVSAQIEHGVVISGLGRVIRILSRADGNEIVLLLEGLSESDLSELTCKTNLAALHQAQRQRMTA